MIIEEVCIKSDSRRRVRGSEPRFFVFVLLLLIATQACGPTRIALPTNSYMLMGYGQVEYDDISDLRLIAYNMADPKELFDFRGDHLKPETDRSLKCISDVTWDVRERLRK